MAHTNGSAFYRKAIAGLPIIMLGSIAGCAGSATQNTPPPPPPPTAIAVSFSSPPPSSLPVAGSVGLTAVVSNTTNTGVNWTVTCGTAGQCGSFPIIEGGLDYVSYSAPNDIPSGKTVTITATSVADATKTASATITITAPIKFAQAMPAALQVSRSESMGAIVGSDSESAPITWSVTCSSADCGSFAPAGTNSFNKTTYSAPAGIPTGGMVTITATSGDDPTQKASATVAIVPATPIPPDGTYVFQFSPPLQMLSLATGAFTVVNGAIIGGEQDSNSLTAQTNGCPNGCPNPQHQKIVSGNITTTVDGALEVDLQVEVDSKGTLMLETLYGVASSGGSGFTAKLYGLEGSGSLELQTSQAAPSGGYAFALRGTNAADDLIWMGGVLNIDLPGAISGTGSIIDLVSTGSQAHTLGAGTVSAPDAFGRVEIAFSSPGPGNPFSINLAGYVVDSTHVRLTEAAGDSFGGYLVGVAFAQGAATQKFDSASISGSTWVFELSGFNNGPYSAAGLLTANADGTVTGKLTWEKLPTLLPQPLRSFGGTWSADPSGRFTLSNLTDNPNNQAGTFEFRLEMYLGSGGNALLLSSSPAGAALTGQAVLRSSPAPDASALAGKFAYSLGQVWFNPPGASGEVWATALFGPVTLSSAGSAISLAGYMDGALTSTTYAGTPWSGTATDQSNGILSASFTGLNPTDYGASNGYYVYMIDKNRAITMEVDEQVLALGYLTRQP